MATTATKAQSILARRSLIVLHIVHIIVVTCCRCCHLLSMLSLVVNNVTYCRCCHQHVLEHSKDSILKGVNLPFFEPSLSQILLYNFLFIPTCQNILCFLLCHKCFTQLRFEFHKVLIFMKKDLLQMCIFTLQNISTDNIVEINRTAYE